MKRILSAIALSLILATPALATDFSQTMKYEIDQQGVTWTKLWTGPEETVLIMQQGDTETGYRIFVNGDVSCTPFMLMNPTGKVEPFKNLAMAQKYAEEMYRVKMDNIRGE